MFRVERVIVVLAVALAGCAAQPALRGTGDLGVVIERAAGRVQVVDTTARQSLAIVEGLGDPRMPRSCTRATAAMRTCSAATADSPRSTC